MKMSPRNQAGGEAISTNMVDEVARTEGPRMQDFKRGVGDVFGDYPHLNILCGDPLIILYSTEIDVQQDSPSVA